MRSVDNTVQVQCTALFSNLNLCLIPDFGVALHQPALTSKAALHLEAGLHLSVICLSTPRAAVAWLHSRTSQPSSLPLLQAQLSIWCVHRYELC